MQHFPAYMLVRGCLVRRQGLEPRTRWLGFTSAFAPHRTLRPWSQGVQGDIDAHRTASLRSNPGGFRQAKR